MKKNSRLIGIDLFRGIAAYAVVVQHSAIAPVSTLASHFHGICGFVVPFFLATSSYL
jgi:peptidoglycan/LPS O-acetylase OafA/YrhL